MKVFSAGGVARRHRWVQVLVAGLVLAWGLLQASRGAWGWVLGGVLLPVLLPALAVALECLMSALFHAGDTSPRAGWRAWLRACGAEIGWCYRLFGWVQPWAEARFPDRPQGRPGRGGSRGVLLVHGYTCGRGMWQPWQAELDRAGIPYVCVDLLPMFGSIEHYAPLIEQGLRELHRATGRAPVVVAHSMGGLAVRAWWRWAQRVQGQGAQAVTARVAAVLTLGTPHRGTVLARAGLTTNARQMRQRSAWLQALAAAETPAWRARFTCVYSHCDNVVFPPLQATLDGAAALPLPGRAHLEMVFDPLVWQQVLALLRQAPAASEVEGAQQAIGGEGRQARQRAEQGQQPGVVGVDSGIGLLG
ncbi:alpha/beta hydrolase family protein [Sphaerotilus hippei]|uniref:Alpha/beta hydrolase family protein n=1 Tax=Sphaerotilus hippei TaxID=744406 RepID=A0A318H5M7_9BURK|nr:alpha/beta hydrolase family protein [Sphaerotilus hippei]